MTLRARSWLYVPDSVRKATPLVVMAHGFSATKQMTLDRYATVFAAAGLSGLVYDHRNTGSSDGQPRFDIDPIATTTTPSPTANARRHRYFQDRYLGYQPWFIEHLT